jgi:hypothetical protein
MDILKWLVRTAGFDDRLRRKADPEPQIHRRLAKRSLASRLSPHLLKDMGADDG